MHFSCFLKCLRHIPGIPVVFQHLKRKMTRDSILSVKTKYSIIRFFVKFLKISAKNTKMTGFVDFPQKCIRRERWEAGGV